jgi:hypothetical protein
VSLELVAKDGTLHNRLRPKTEQETKLEIRGAQIVDQLLQIVCAECACLDLEYESMLDQQIDSIGSDNDPVVVHGDRNLTLDMQSTLA